MAHPIFLLLLFEYNVHIHFDRVVGITLQSFG
ncbi:hypothetical protein J512_4192, partial [Acinetobacter baumannii 1295743]